MPLPVAKIKTIFFDISDTLYHSPDFEKAQSDRPIIQLSEIKGIAFEAAEELFSKTKKVLMHKMGHASKVAVMMEFGISRIEMQEFLAQLNPGDFLQPDEEINAILARLNTRFELGVITNVLRIFLDKILDSLKINRSHFTYIVSVDNTTKGKPAPEPFLKAIEISKHQANECVYVGDSLTKDMLPARRAGMRTIWVSPEARADDQVDVVINSIYEIERGIKKL